MARRRGLTPEDRELWTRVARTATPLHPAAAAPRDKETPDREKGDAPGPKSPPSPRAGFALPAGPRPGAAAGSGAGRAVGHDPAPSPAQALEAHPLRMDHKTHRQMTRGRLRPEAKLDLHGMTLAEAGPELAGFILSCHMRGLRLVLVITGKGSRDGDHGPLPVRRGALRHQVPHWLHGGPLARVVQQVVPAHARHGGAGAYYVYLRR